MPPKTRAKAKTSLASQASVLDSIDTSSPVSSIKEAEPLERQSASLEKSDAQKVDDAIDAMNVYLKTRKKNIAANVKKHAGPHKITKEEPLTSNEMANRGIAGATVVASQAGQWLGRGVRFFKHNIVNSSTLKQNRKQAVETCLAALETETELQKRLELVHGLFIVNTGYTQEHFKDSYFYEDKIYSGKLHESLYEALDLNEEKAEALTERFAQLKVEKTQGAEDESESDDNSVASSLTS
jgi:hypothetical protein